LIVRAVVVSLIVVPGTASVGESQSGGKIPDQVLAARDAVVLIRAFDDSSREISLGSGFFVDNGRIITNAHVVTGAARVEVFDNDGRFLGGTDFAENLSTTRDLVVLPPIGEPSSSLVIDPSLPTVGDRVVAIGSPLGLSNTISEGIVSGIRSLEGQAWIQTTAPISPGSSGGPLLNFLGQVVGVTTALMQDGQNLNFVIPGRDVATILGSPPGRVGFPPRRSDGHKSGSDSPIEEPKSESRGEPRIGSLTDEAFTRESISFLFYPGTNSTWHFAAGSDRTDINIYVFTSEDGEIVSAGHAASNGSQGTFVVFRTIPGKDYLIFVESESGTGSFQYLLTEQRNGRWIEVARASTGTVFLVDKNALRRRTRTTIEALVSVILPEPEKTTWKPRKLYDEIQDELLFDCRSGSTGRVRSTFRNRGVYVDSYKQPDVQWSQSSPGSVDHTILEKVCFLSSIH